MVFDVWLTKAYRKHFGLVDVDDLYVYEVLLTSVAANRVGLTYVSESLPVAVVTNEAVAAI